MGVDFYTEKRLNKKKFIVVFLVILFILIIIGGAIVYNKNDQFREWADVNIFKKELTTEDVATIELSSDSNASVYAYYNYIGVLSNNSFTIYNTSGNQEQNLDVNVSNPIYNSSKKFLVIAEEGGQKVYLISGKEVAWSTDIEGTVSSIAVNRNGYVAVAITNTSYKTIINVYNPSGKELFKIYLSTSRVESMSISNDNKYIAFAEINTSSSVIQSNVKIVSIENAQTDSDNSFVYIHNADSGKLLINLKYQDKNKLVCMYDDSITVIEDEQNTELINFSENTINFSTINLSNNIAYIEERSSGLFSADSQVTFKDITNSKETTYVVEDVLKDIYSCEDILALNLGSEIYFVNTSGWLVKRYVSNQEISSVVLSDMVAAIVYRNKIEIINL